MMSPFRVLIALAVIGVGDTTAAQIAPQCCEQPTSVGSPASTRITWPVAPETPRIVYIASLSSERDIGRRATGFARFLQRIAGTEDRALTVQRPHDVVVDRMSRAYVTDGSRRQVMVFDPTARAARPIGTDGAGRLVKPMGLAIDEKDNVYVADQGGKRVVAFSPSGAFVRAYGGARALINPVAVAVDTTAGIVWVADSYLHEVLGYRRTDGVLLHRLGRNETDVAAKRKRTADPVVASHGSEVQPSSADLATRAALGHAQNTSAEPRDIVENRGVAPSEFRYPSFLAVGADGTLYVCDAMNFRVQVFDRNGKYLRQVGRHGDRPGTFARPKGIAVDGEGHLYVADAAFNNVQIFDRQGRVLLAFAGLGRDAGELWMPLGLSIDANDRIYIADRYNNRVQIYEYLNATRLAAAGKSGRTGIRTTRKP